MPSYESSTKIANGVLHFRRTFTVKQVALPAKRIDDLERLALAIATDEQSSAVLKKKS